MKFGNIKLFIAKFCKSILIILMINIDFSSADNGYTGYNGSTNISATSNLINNPMVIDNYYKKLICTSNGLAKFDESNNSWNLILNNSISNNYFNSIAVDVTNTYWIATNDNGLCRYDGASWIVYNTGNSDIISNNLTKVYINDGKIYIGSNIGFSIFQNGIFTNYNTSNSGLVNNQISDFVCDYNNNLFIGTNNGLSKFDGLNFTNFSSANSGLLSDKILSLYYDGSAVWIGTLSKSLHRFSNNSILNIQDFWDTPIRFYSNSAFGSNIYSICTGPRGGVCFSGGGQRIYEIYQNTLYTYFGGRVFSTNQYTSASAKIYLAFDPHNQTIWSAGLYKKLVSFNLSEYNGYASSNTFDNFRTLNINQVSASMLNRGAMFFDKDAEVSSYKVPKNDNKSAAYANSLWMAALDNNSSLHLAAQTYLQSGTDYWPGPLDTINGETDTLTAVLYDKIWKINWFDIEQFRYFYDIGQVQNGTWQPGSDILTWPAQGIGNISKSLAPFVDVNHDGFYNPIQDGDYPDIKGDQMLYWIFNDNLGAHEETKGKALKIEVHASAYAFSCPELSNADSSINYSTFYNYKIFNRSGIDYDSCFVGNYNDFDIGNAIDDVCASNPKSNMAFSFNFDALDEGNIGYGANPPAVGNVILNGPMAYLNDLIDNDNDGIFDEIGEKNLMSSCIFYENSGNTINGNAFDSLDFYNYLKGRWKNNSSLTYGGNGIGGATPTHFMFSDSSWLPTAMADVRSLQSSGPFSFPANSSIDYDFAIVYARDTVGNDSPQLFQQLFDNAARAKSWFDGNTFPSCVGPNKIKAIETELNHLEVFPNPANEIINFKSTNKKPVLSYTIYNAMGKAIVSNTNVNTNEIYIKHFAKGIYFLQLKFVDGKSSTQKFIKN